MASTTRITWVDGMAFVGESPSGHTLVMDGPPEVGGRNVGIRPMEMLILGLGGCTASDVMVILRKARQTVTGCEIRIEAERADTVPKVFTRIHLHYVVTGRGLEARHVERAIKLSKEKYCSATIMLAATARITSDFEVHEAP
jgi:putative redox protein